MTVETVGYKTSCLTMWCVRGQDKIQPLRRQFHLRIHGLVYVVGSSDRDRIEDAKEELDEMLNGDEMRDAVAPVLEKVFVGVKGEREKRRIQRREERREKRREERRGEKREEGKKREERSVQL